MSARSRLLFLLVASVVTFTAARPARADFVLDPKVAEPDPPPTPRWYGYQTLGVDAISAALVAGTSAVPLLGVVGYLGYVVGGPIVHGVHHRDGALVLDLLLRLTAPIAGFAIGAASARCAAPPSTGDNALSDAFCPLAGGVAGVEVGMLAVSLFDATVLGWDSVPAHRELASRALAPTLAVTPGGGIAGLGGSF
jgi:hypothetical protein